MDPQDTIDFSREALTMVAIVGGPILVAGLAIGLIVGIFQAMTQIQDQTVSAVPKILGMLLVTMMVLPWVGQRMVEYTEETLSTPMIGGIAPVEVAKPSPFKFASASTQITPAFHDGPVARIAANVAKRAAPLPEQSTTAMPMMLPPASSMPIHPYGQSPATNRSSMPRLQDRDLSPQPLKNIEL